MGQRPSLPKSRRGPGRWEKWLLEPQGCVVVVYFVCVDVLGSTAKTEEMGKHPIVRFSWVSRKPLWLELEVNGSVWRQCMQRVHSLDVDLSRWCRPTRQQTLES